MISAFISATNEFMGASSNKQRVVSASDLLMLDDDLKKTCGFVENHFAVLLLKRFASNTQ